MNFFGPSLGGGASPPRHPRGSAADSIHPFAYLTAIVVGHQSVTLFIDGCCGNAWNCLKIAV